VDTSLFRLAPRAEGEGPRYLFAGSLIERKNVERLLEAFASLGIGTLTVAGAGPLEHRLRAAAPPGVTFMGRVEPSEMAALYAACDVYCQPSLVEPQGQALLEALACGRPVVATRVGGPPEYVSEACGALVDPHDVASIADGMRRAAAIGAPCAAAIEVAEHHSIDRQAARIERLLADVSSGRDG
jgi:glycosyltransferase involved in cell wall biosynthesis